MKIYYLFQSGFIIESKSAILIVDYFRASNEALIYLHNILKTTTKKVYVLASHSHSDHFNKEIFSWLSLNDEITYILPSDIILDLKESRLIDKIAILDKFETFFDNILLVKAYGSTDLGVSFYIEIDDKKLFHAGDLNNWHWNNAFSEKEIEEAESFYLSELSFITNDIKSIDILFFPLDPRLGKDYAKGAIQFMAKIKTEVLIPMHFSDKELDYIELQNLFDKSIDYKFKLVEIIKENFQINL